ncbi:hypothetical protein [Aliiroseovarius sediminis]|uniref:hypothetical protein n=1 Tax=Aliiroseovarius sediminis TaxID=2925839 RepID=UPI001F56979E|nr:hypothetical protein [Aliiroseovarius sediminis]MCI2395373.1 hypothetical protein [Aliiroseovarius sediminis]
MPNKPRPIVSIIIRRFRQELENDIMQSLRDLQKVAAKQPGYLGDQNHLSHDQGYCELVNVFAFDSDKNLKRWEASDERKKHLEILDAYPHETTNHIQFDELAPLLGPAPKTSKFEIVVILIFWIVLNGAVLGYLADFLLPATFPPFGRTVLLISINVMLISYIFLPWSSTMLTRLKVRFS